MTTPEKYMTPPTSLLSADAINGGSKRGRQREDAPNSGTASRLQPNYWQKGAVTGWIMSWLPLNIVKYCSFLCEFNHHSFFFYPQLDSLSGSSIKTKHSSCWACETLGEKRLNESGFRSGFSWLHSHGSFSVMIMSHFLFLPLNIIFQFQRLG